MATPSACLTRNPKETLLPPLFHTSFDPRSFIAVGSTAQSDILAAFLNTDES
jgi:hypothetical protein